MRKLRRADLEKAEACFLESSKYAVSDYEKGISFFGHAQFHVFLGNDQNAIALLNKARPHMLKTNSVYIDHLEYQLSALSIPDERVDPPGVVKVH